MKKKLQSCHSDVPFLFCLSKFHPSCLFSFADLMWKGICFPLLNTLVKGILTNFILTPEVISKLLHSVNTSNQMHHFCSRKLSLLGVTKPTQTLPQGQECQHLSPVSQARHSTALQAAGHIGLPYKKLKTPSYSSLANRRITCDGPGLHLDTFNCLKWR